jgi:hypothetical protein
LNGTELCLKENLRAWYLIKEDLFLLDWSKKYKLSNFLYLKRIETKPEFINKTTA